MSRLRDDHLPEMARNATYANRAQHDVPVKNVERWTIYALMDPDTGVCRYIGKSDDPQRRVREHADQALAKYNRSVYEINPQAPIVLSAKEQWLANCWMRYRLPVVVELETGTGEGWREAEQQWIATALFFGCSLYNLTNGG